jgi:hypothetical protein
MKKSDDHKKSRKVEPGRMSKEESIAVILREAKEASEALRRQRPGTFEEMKAQGLRTAPEPLLNRPMKPATPTSEPQPLSYEDRRKADKVRLARLAEASASHEAWLTERERSEMRRLESLPKRDWSEEIWLDGLKRKLGR